MAQRTTTKKIPALRVHQWLPEWDKMKFSAAERRAKPLPHFYLFCLPAAELRSLCGIFRREAKGVSPRAADLGIQRAHDSDRSDEITRFVEAGNPWSTLSAAKRANPDFNDLRKPGWLPTAIVVNILSPGDKREGKVASADDAISVKQSAGLAELSLPYSAWSETWEPTVLPPLEVIDGQHRLWAFEDDKANKDFELPVVAFHGLDISWQAYLFWTINIKPKRINTSLAFDLYPLLRAEDWLEKSEEHVVYRDTRSQELTEALWSYSQSPWYDKINMLGERKSRWVSQASWIRSLTASFVRRWDPHASGSGGLFGARLDADGEVLGWSRAQQAAFLIYVWSRLSEEIRKTKSPWAARLRGDAAKDAAERGGAVDPVVDAAFYGPFSLLATDQGVRGVLQVTNDICYVMAAKLRLDTWTVKINAPAIDEDAISTALWSAPRDRSQGES